ncbi:hypothetical protein, partial [Mycobacterium avium]|uniref:hypothetical protein n=1 Tax=Mycobacterium avium TaxID=1764 RepID=UPI001E37D27F
RTARRHHTTRTGRISRNGGRLKHPNPQVLTIPPKPSGDWNPVVAATLRVEQARRDHNEAQRAIHEYPLKKHIDDPTATAVSRDVSIRTRWPDLLTED